MLHLRIEPTINPRHRIATGKPRFYSLQGRGSTAPLAAARCRPRRGRIRAPIVPVGQTEGFSPVSPASKPSYHVAPQTVTSLPKFFQNSPPIERPDPDSGPDFAPQPPSATRTSGRSCPSCQPGRFLASGAADNPSPHHRADQQLRTPVLYDYTASQGLTAWTHTIPRPIPGRPSHSRPCPNRSCPRTPGAR